MPPSPPHARPPGRVLVVDDHADGVECLALLLRMNGWAVAVYPSASWAAGAAAAFRADVVVFDLLRDGRGGGEVARAVAALPPLRPGLVAYTALTPGRARAALPPDVPVEVVGKGDVPAALLAALARAAGPAV